MEIHSTLKSSTVKINLILIFVRDIIEKYIQL